MLLMSARPDMRLGKTSTTAYLARQEFLNLKDMLRPHFGGLIAHKER